jgi:uroporphyrinogen III methyltransferase/synthase
VRLRERISWFESRPLFGKRIGITRPAQQALPTVARCYELGAEPVLLPTIEILPPEDWSPVDEAIDRLAERDWLVFTSANGVARFLGRILDRGEDVRRLGGVKIACIGPATASRLWEYHLRADVVPESYRAEALGAALGPHVAGRRVCWARADRGRDVLPTVLAEAGAVVEEVVVYRNRDIDGFNESELARLENRQVDWVGLSSPSIARAFQRMLSPAAASEIGRTIKIATISPVTSAAAAEAGLPVHAEASTFTWDGIFEAIAAAE